MELDFANAVELAPATAVALNVTISGTKAGALYVCTKASGGSAAHILVDGKEAAIAAGNASDLIPQYVYGVQPGARVTSDAALSADAAGRKVTFIPYAD